MIRFQYYSGNIKKANPLGFVTLNQFNKKHINPSDKMLEVFQKIEEASKNGDKKLKAELKMENLYSFTISAIFDGNRKYSNIVEFTGLAQLDFDGLEEEVAVKLRDYLFEHYRYLACTYLSPSRRGVKAIIRIPKISIEQGYESAVKEYKEYYNAIEEEFEGIFGYDPAPKNLVLPLFISYDFFMNIRPIEECKVWDLKKTPKEALSQDYPLPRKPYKKLKSNDKNELRAVRTIRKSIDAITSSPGHFQLRSSCLILGTRVGAGYLSMSQAEQEVENLIRSNSYLSKGVSGYLQTGIWALEKGALTPKEY
tara:strand:+ start:2769 stop:3698 length:930 start_codon:yes stop_codon:yes gene_type:complete